MHAQFDLAIERAEGGTGPTREIFFDNECDADVAQGTTSASGPDSTHDMKQIGGQESAPLKSPADVYQTIDIFAYGFVPAADVPRPVLPSFARGGSPLSPACGAVWSTCGARAAEGGLGYAELSCGRLVLGAVRTSSAVSAELTLRNICGAPVTFTACDARRGD